MNGQLDIVNILDRLPHRYPFLLVDRVLELESGKRVVALKNVTFNEPFFQGHFPMAPVMPGVLIIEALAQAGGVLAAVTRQIEQKKTPIYFMTIDNVKFRKPVTPGDQLILDLTILKQRGKVMRLAGKALVDEKVVAEAELMATIGEEK